MSERRLRSASVCRKVSRAGAGFAKVVVVLAVALSMKIGFAAPAGAAGDLDRLIQQVDLKALFPAADRFDRPDGTPPVVRARKGSDPLGYVFLNSDFVSAIGYSGKPIHALVAVDDDGVIRGARLTSRSS